MFDSFQSIGRFGRYIEGQGLKLSRTMHGVLQAVSGIVQYAFFPRLGLRAVSCQRLIACADLPLIPIRELGAPSCLRRSIIKVAAHHVTGLVIGYRRDGICAVPNKRSLGAVNGLAHMVASIQRTIGPAAADWLFVFSLMNIVLGGNFAYVILVLLVGVGVCVSVRLPLNVWTHSSN
ncbi:hypothetical protein EDB83DRAFT_1719445 [Lactarius deliciosus]|nr:hypothetical protein EDB83DRAFT_1719445 [Lactarius deliciosus]